MVISIYKTNVKYQKHIKSLKPQLDLMTEVSKWNFDLDDCDKILRIVSENDISPEVIRLMERNGFLCEELI